MTVPFRDPRLKDEDLDVEAAPEPSIYDELRAEVTAEVATAPLTLQVPDRPGYEVRYSTTIRDTQLETWTTHATKAAKAAGFTQRLFLCALILGNQCEAIIRQGDEVRLDDGVATFRSEAFRGLLEVDRAVLAVRKFYGRDSAILNDGLAVLTAAGYGEDALEGGEERVPTDA